MNAFAERPTLTRLISLLLVGIFALTVLPAPLRAGFVRTSQSAEATAQEPDPSATQRAQDMKLIRRTLEQKKVRAKLRSLGFQPVEVERRVERLSDQQIHTMASRLRTVKAGGHSPIPPLSELGLFLTIVVIILAPIVGLIMLFFLLFHGHVRHHDHAAVATPVTPGG